MSDVRHRLLEQKYNALKEKLRAGAESEEDDWRDFQKFVLLVSRSGEHQPLIDFFDSVIDVRDYLLVHAGVVSLHWCDKGSDEGLAKSVTRLLDRTMEQLGDGPDDQVYRGVFNLLREDFMPKTPYRGRP